MDVFGMRLYGTSMILFIIAVVIITYFIPEDIQNYIVPLLWVGALAIIVVIFIPALAKSILEASEGEELFKRGTAETQLRIDSAYLKKMKDAENPKLSLSKRLAARGEAEALKKLHERVPEKKK